MPFRLLVVRHLGPFCLYWVTGFLAWLAFTNNAHFWELVLGAFAATLAGIGAEVARSAGVAKFRLRLSWILEGWRLPWYVLQGCWQILVQLVKPHQPSVLRSVVYDAGGDDGASAARRALTVTYTTMPPNFVILDIDRAHDVMIVHQVTETPTPIMTKHLGAKS